MIWNGRAGPAVAMSTLIADAQVLLGGRAGVDDDLARPGGPVAALQAEGRDLAGARGGRVEALAEPWAAADDLAVLAHDPGVKVGDVAARARDAGHLVDLIEHAGVDRRLLQGLGVVRRSERAGSVTTAAVPSYADADRSSAALPIVSVSVKAAVIVATPRTIASAVSVVRIGRTMRPLSAMRSIRRSQPSSGRARRPRTGWRRRPRCARPPGTARGPRSRRRADRA